MQLVLWFIAGASAGYLAGSGLFDDEGIGIWGHIILGAIAGVAGGLACAVGLGVTNPLDTFNPLPIAVAAVFAGVSVVAVNEVAERQRLGI